MFAISEVELLAVVAVFLVVIALAAAVSWGNPVVDVADELTTTLPVTEVETRIGEALAVVPGVQVRLVLPATWTVSYRRHPRYSVVLGVLTLPLGLLVLLLVRETLQLTVSATRHEDTTRVLVAGRTHQKLALALGDVLPPLVTPGTLPA